MEIFETLDAVSGIRPSAVALGNFDGVHLGHQELIKRTVEKARSEGLTAAVFTFSSHPKNLLPKEKKVKNIIVREDKEKLIASLGVDYLFNVPFTKAIMTMSPQDFVKKLLVDKFNMKAAFCGFNYHFGYKAAGNPEVLGILRIQLSFRL